MGRAAEQQSSRAGRKSEMWKQNIRLFFFLLYLLSFPSNFLLLLLSLSQPIFQLTAFIVRFCANITARRLSRPHATSLPLSPPLLCSALLCCAVIRQSIFTCKATPFEKLAFCLQLSHTYTCVRVCVVGCTTLAMIFVAMPRKLQH